jgi:hypothetical protein
MALPLPVSSTPWSGFVEGWERVCRHYGPGGGGIASQFWCDRAITVGPALLLECYRALEAWEEAEKAEPAPQPHRQLDLAL